MLAGTTLAGRLPISDAATQRFGVYLNDATGAKMDMHLDVKVGAVQVICRKDLRPTYGVEVTLTNTAPADAATSLPEYVTGGGYFGVTPGNVQTIVSVYGPKSMQNLGVTRDGKKIGYYPTTDTGYPVSSLTVELAPGDSTTITYGWLGAKPFSGDIVTQMTPVIFSQMLNKAILTITSNVFNVADATVHDAMLSLDDAHRISRKTFTAVTTESMRKTWGEEAHEHR